VKGSTFDGIFQIAGRCGKCKCPKPSGYIVRTASKSVKNYVFWDVTPCGSCKNRVSEGLSASIIRVTGIGELGTLAVISNRRVPFFIVTAVKTSNLT
jgi:hypothetical protein